ncbi:MAG TPA: hypothetical protein VEL07_12025 [Planctomycetota bacterium]|nr:hypothetical protein [Planctomycetota bacterium]
MLLAALPLLLGACEVDCGPSVWAGDIVGQSSWAMGCDRWYSSDSRHARWHEPPAWHEGWRPGWHHDHHGYARRRASRPPLDPPTVIVHQPGYYAQVGDEAVWVPDAYGSEPVNTITRHARGRRHRDEPAAREAPTLPR